jgi:hypothetical protein
MSFPQMKDDSRLPWWDVFPGGAWPAFYENWEVPTLEGFVLSFGGCPDNDERPRLKAFS